MTFKPAIWRPIALVLSAINLAGAGYAVASTEPMHAAVHVALALAFGFWAQRLQQRPGGRELQAGGLEALEAEVTRLRQEVGEMQERMDFAERLLAQRPEAGRAGPPR
jgi:hypothetical protein